MSGTSQHEIPVPRLDPRLHPAEYVFTTVDGPPNAALNNTALNPVATVGETEGTTLVLPRTEADSAGLHYDYIAARITLRVQSTLDMVGLSAVVSTALADAGLSCNIIAGYYHDHLFVASEHARQALAVLHELSGKHRTATRE